MALLYNILFGLVTLLVIVSIVKVWERYHPSLTWFGFLDKNYSQRKADNKGAFLILAIVFFWFILLGIRMSL